MKKILTSIAMLTLLSSTASFARSSDVTGSITLRDGGSVVRINVGREDDRDSRSMAIRLRRLESAVRELQNRVYELEDEGRGREVTVHTCSLPTSFEGTFIGKGSTRVEARANAVNACERGGGFPCSESRIKACETSTQIVNY